MANNIYLSGPTALLFIVPYNDFLAEGGALDDS